MAKKTAKKARKGKKAWFTIQASQGFGNKPIGETVAFEAEELVGKPVKIDLGTLTGDIKRQQVKITFEIIDVEGHNAKTKVMKYEISPSYLKRAVKREKIRIDESFTAKTKNNLTIRIKPFIIVTKKANSVQQKLIRRAVKEILVKEIAQRTIEDLIKDIISFALVKKLKYDIKKIYPLRIVEIKAVKVIKKKKTYDEKKAEEKNKVAAKEIKDKQEITKEEANKEEVEKEPVKKEAVAEQ